jgi:hypothetical protein
VSLLIKILQVCAKCISYAHLLLGVLFGWLCVIATVVQSELLNSWWTQRKNKMETEEQYVLYILMRTDLPSMNAGKAMAQASHASNAFMNKVKKDFDMSEISIKAVEWEKQTNQGFGTVLVLGATLDDIRKIREWDNEQSSLFDPEELQPRNESHLFEEVVDPTYPYIVNSEIAGLIDKNVHTGESPIELESGDCLCLRNEVTCAYLFADKNNEQIKELLGELTLHP